MRARANSGYTLLEVLVVCAIVAVLTGVAGYSLRLVGGTRFTEQRAILLDRLTTARNMASMRSECVRVSIDRDVMTVDAFTADIGRTCSGPFVNPVRSLPPVNFADAGVTVSAFSNGSTFMVFNTQGGVVGDTLLTLDATDKEKQSAHYRIYPAIGQIRMN